MIEMQEGEHLTAEECLHEAEAELRLAGDLYRKMQKTIAAVGTRTVLHKDLVDVLDICKHLGDAVQRVVAAQSVEPRPERIRAALEPGATLTRARASDVGHDLRAMIGTPRTLAAWSRWICRTGVYLELPDDVEAQIRPRSGLTHHHGVVVELDTVSLGAVAERGLVPGIGTVDPGYRGELEVVLFNNSDQDYTIQPGERVAQLVFNRVVLPELEFVAVEDLAPSDRGVLGKGSSGRL